MNLIVASVGYERISEMAATVETTATARYLLDA